MRNILKHFADRRTYFDWPDWRYQQMFIYDQAAERLKRLDDWTPRATRLVAYLISVSLVASLMAYGAYQ